MSEQNKVNEAAIKAIMDKFQDINTPATVDAELYKQGVASILFEAGIPEMYHAKVWERMADRLVTAYQMALDSKVELETQKAEDEQDFKQSAERKMQASMDDDGASMTPEEASYLINKITSDPNDAYMDKYGKFSAAERDRRVSYVDRLREIQHGQATSVQGYWVKHEQDKAERMKVLYNDPFESKSSSYNGRQDKPTENEGEDVTQPDQQA